MQTRTLTELTQLYWIERAPLSPLQRETLRGDPRAGVRALAARLARREEAERLEQIRLVALQKFEHELWSTGLRYVAGVDEAGVGPLAGPVVAGACILPPDFRPRGLDDSKQLDEATRGALEATIKTHAVAWSVGLASVDEVDTLNPYHAGLLAMRRAVEGLSVRPDFLLVDARSVPGVPIPQRAIIKGDALSLSIAAASVLAKTHRDRMMSHLARAYPGYGFEAHMGYGTREHLDALGRLGPCPVHRRSYAPVREALRLDMGQARS